MHTHTFTHSVTRFHTLAPAVKRNGNNNKNIWQGRKGTLVECLGKNIMAHNLPSLRYCKTYLHR